MRRAGTGRTGSDPPSRDMAEPDPIPECAYSILVSNRPTPLKPTEGPLTSIGMVRPRPRRKDSSTPAARSLPAAGKVKPFVKEIS
jgi:hypothetical protein